MKTTSGILLAAVSFATAAMMQSCEKKDLCYDHGHMVDLQINFDWSQAPDADPHTMVVRLFRPDGSHYAVYELTNTNTDHIRVEAGEYIMLCHNGEMDNVTEIEGDYTDYALTTRPRALLAPMNRGDEQLPPRPGMSTGELVRSTPERVWAVQGEVLNLRPKVTGQKVTVTPREATSHYTVTITKVENLNPGIDISGAITGMVRAACPEPDTTKKLNTDWNTYISHAEITGGNPCMPWLILWRMVFSTVPSVALVPPRIMMMPCAIPTHMAAPRRSAAPLSKDVAMSLSFISFKWKITPMIPDTRPITKNCDAISGI